MGFSKYDHILVRYGELTTKGKNRREFINRLLNNIKNALRQYPALEYVKTYDRIFIKLNDEDAMLVSGDLGKVFGISSFSLSLKVETNMEVIEQTALSLMSNQQGSTFKVIARRKDKSFPLISDQINRNIAKVILSNTDWKVDVKTPDVKLEVEVDTDYTYIMAGKIEGAMGYPVGVGGRALLMLSGGIDSPVAGIMTMKRGVRVEAIHFASPPFTSDRALEKVKMLAKKLAKYQGHVRLHVVHFTKLQQEIYKKVDEAYAITIMRRMMYRIAESVAEENRCLAIISGDSLGQVASQTLESMSAIGRVTDTLILRPLVGMDKNEIISIANKIDTYETSILPFEDCCTIFTPKNPVIKPKIEKCERFEQRFDFQELLDECNSTVETLIFKANDEENELF